jgi:hypothetical protein
VAHNALAHHQVGVPPLQCGTATHGTDLPRWIQFGRAQAQHPTKPHKLRNMNQKQEQKNGTKWVVLKSLYMSSNI